jgi:hypothetical protein
METAWCYGHWHTCTRLHGKSSPYNRSRRPKGGSRCIALLSLTSALDAVGGQRHAPAALPPGKTRYPLHRRLGRPQGRSGRVRKISPPPEFYPRTVQSVLYRIRYSGPQKLHGSITKYKYLSPWDLHTLHQPAHNYLMRNESQVPQSETTEWTIHLDRIQACDKPNPSETPITVHWSQPSYHDQYSHIRRKGSNVCLVTLLCISEWALSGFTWQLCS